MLGTVYALRGNPSSNHQDKAMNMNSNSNLGAGRRGFITTLVALTAGAALSESARAATPDANAVDAKALASTLLGDANAPLSIQEYFSFTCPHCAKFSTDTLPALRTKYIDTGLMNWTFREYPLDKVALQASVVARSLTTERYHAFTTALMSTQDRWTQASGSKTPMDGLRQFCALAGVSSARFTELEADLGLQRAVIEERMEGSKLYGVDQTPTFILKRKGQTAFQKKSGALSMQDFSAWLDHA